MATWSSKKIRKVQVRIQPRAPIMIKINKDHGKHYHKYYYDIDFTPMKKVITFISNILVSIIDKIDYIYDNWYVIFIKPTM